MPNVEIEGPGNFHLAYLPNGKAIVLLDGSMHGMSHISGLQSGIYICLSFLVIF